jgi:peptidoglycan/LPS O-acetylase OafA/YrhL
LSAAADARVPGWDALRGLCAVLVAAYHLLSWTDMASLHVYGTYGVYLFFVLSGASLAYTYGAQVERGEFVFLRFLWVRYVRLAPLYLTLMVLVLPWKLVKHGAGFDLLREFFLNTTFLFGLVHPASSSFLVGGWSLGIEAVFYLLFPAFIAAALRPRLGLPVFALLIGLQLWWIGTTVGSGGYAATAAVYHQAPAFAAYFMGGCLLGLWRRATPATGHRQDWLAARGIAIGLVLMLLVNPRAAGDELLGWRGPLLGGMCFLLVWLAGAWRPTWARAASALGDASYGLYLIHPVIFFGLAALVLPRWGAAALETWPLAGRAVFVVVVIVLSAGLGWVSERFMERPIRRRSRSWMDRPTSIRSASIRSPAR